MFTAVRESVCPCIPESVRASRTLLTQYLEKYWTYFRQTFSIDAFCDKDDASFFGVKGQRSRSQHDKGPSGRMHTELDAVRLVSSLTRVHTLV